MAQANPIQIVMLPGCTGISIRNALPGSELTVFYNDFTNPIDFEALELDPISVNGEGDTFIFPADLGQIDPTITAPLANGVYQITDGENAVSVVAHCDIDCCITHRMARYLNSDCGCNGGNCEAAMDLTTKIFLMAIASDFTLKNNPAAGADAYLKYLKAVELCNLDGCGCSTC